MILKKCTGCKSFLPLSKFHKNKSTKDGLHNWCKCCRNEHELKPSTRESRRKYNQEYYKAHKKEINAQTTQYKANKLKNDPIFRAEHNMRGRLSELIKYAGGKKTKNYRKLIGCSAKKLSKHIESQFLPGMSWDNYGYHGWHIDHIVPCSAFDLSKEEEQRKCCHYTNLQPLWAKDNLTKGNKIL